jgi:hypothetical protein
LIFLGGDINRKTKNPYISAEVFVGLLGFEPRQTESKSVVLPLHHNPISKHFCVWECKNRGFVKKPKLFLNLFLNIDPNPFKGWHLYLFSLYSLSSFSFKDFIKSSASATTSHIIVIKEPGFAVLYACIMASFSL